MAQGNASLDAYGANVGRDPPRIVREHAVRTAQSPGGDNLAGFVGELKNRSGYGFVKPAEKGSEENPRHWLYALDAYAISDDALEMAKQYGVSRVLVVEEDTGCVLEWPITHFDTPVPQKFLFNDSDTQTYAECENATFWTDHAESVYVGDF